MDLLFGFGTCFILLVFSALRGISVIYPLIAGLIIFICISLLRGFPLKEVLMMSYNGGKKSFVVLKIFLLIGAIISVWMSAGTVPAIVYYGIEFLNPEIFILCAFLISCFVSFLIGTSFGTVGTVGIALIVMARAGGTSIPACAGAIIAGAYFGDRCSPMSSSAYLVATITDTDIYTNIKNMVKTSIVPFIAACIFYVIVSVKYPINFTKSNIGIEIAKLFDLNLIVLVPAAIILVLSLFRIEVKLSMLLSIISAALISFFLQHNTIIDIIKFLIFGFELKEPSILKTIITGGGILSMVKISLIVFISSAFTGIFEETGMLKSVQNFLAHANGKYQSFLYAIIASIASSAFGCTQALAVILTHLLIKDAYEKNKISKYDLAVDLENSAIVIAPLIPWNIAGLVPLTSMKAGFESLLFCFYLFLVPAYNLLRIKKGAL